MVSLTTSTMHRRAEKIGALLLERGHLNSGDHVALIYAPGVDLVCAFYGCLYVGTNILLKIVLSVSKNFA